MHTRSIRPHSPYEIACWACVIGWLKFVHFVTDGPFGLHSFGRSAGLPSEDLQQHGVIYLIVLGFAAAGIAAMLFFWEESNAGNAFRAIRKDSLLAQSQGIKCQRLETLCLGALDPRLSNSSICSGVNGRLISAAPSASATALAMQAGVLIALPSATPLAPSGVTGEGLSICRISNSGIIEAVGTA